MSRAGREQRSTVEADAAEADAAEAEAAEAEAIEARPPRVLLLAQRPQRRGAEMAAYRLGAALARAGCAARRLYLYPYEGDAPLSLVEGDAVIGGEPGHPFERFPGLHPAPLGRLRRLIAAFAPDIVQAHGGRTVKYAAAARRLDASAGWAFVYRNIGDPRHWSTAARALVYRRLVMPQVDGVAAVSAATLAAVRSHYRLGGVPAADLPSGVDPEALRPARPAAEVRSSLGTPERAPVVLYVGSLSAEKRLDRLFAWAAGARRQHPGLRIWLVGDGPSREQAERSAGALGFGEAATFLGAQERVGDYLAAADLLLLSSDTEGLPGVVVEAAVSGLPAVATAVGGVAECIEDGLTGLLVDPQDEAAGAAAVAALLADPERRRAMGAAARRRAEERYLIDAVARRYLGFYRRVLAHRRGVAAG